MQIFPGYRNPDSLTWGDRRRFVRGGGGGGGAVLSVIT